MDKSKNSILIIEDSATSIYALNDILSPEFIVYTEKDSKVALKTAEKHMPDIILLDVIMPDKDGYEVLQELKASCKVKHIPVIFITTLKEEGYEEKGFTFNEQDMQAVGKDILEPSDELSDEELEMAAGGTTAIAVFLLIAGVAVATGALVGAAVGAGVGAAVVGVTAAVK